MFEPGRAAEPFILPGILRGSRCLFPRAANDNGAEEWPPVLTAALRHFAQSRLAASRSAAMAVEAALTAGDKVDAAQWLAIARLFGGSWR